MNSQTFRTGMDENKDAGATKSNGISIPQINLPKGGGALKGIDEKFQINAVNGTANLSIPLPISPARNGFSPQLSLSYNSGSGNSIFGLGWAVDFPMIQRKTERKLPRYREDNEEDVFMLRGEEDLVPYLVQDHTNWILREYNYEGYQIKRYRPRVEGKFAKIEMVTDPDQEVYWKLTTKDNIVTFFGRHANCRIADPEDSKKVFKWLPEFSFDNKGSCINYEYKEDSNLEEEARQKIPNRQHEKNRKNGYALFTNQYLKRIRYCNRVHYSGPNDNPFELQISGDIQYLFALVFDYGEHNIDRPAIDEAAGQEWNYREDAFSDYRAGFEIRTARLCKRILMFHLFEELGAEPCLVKSLDLDFQASSINQSGYAETTYLKSASQKSYIRNADGGYISRSLPPTEFFYNNVEWNEEIKKISKEELTNAPTGLIPPYHWVDYYGEGVSGIFTEQAGEWFYKSNLGITDGDGNIKFSTAKIIDTKPSFTGFNSGQLQFHDLDANGRKNVTTSFPGVYGYFELSEENEWDPYMGFEELPTNDLKDPNIRAIDLDGDGKPDLLISEENAWLWYPSTGKKGYRSAEFATKTFDEEKGPAIIFADGQQTIYLADLNGDGLTDIVRIRNGEICYWANKGYGCFSAKVSMSNAPWFDHPDNFNPQYIYLADLSGTGATDILYAGKHLCRAYLNLSGNAWSDAHVIDRFPVIENKSQLAVVDILGSGTPCLVWSSALANDENSSLRYIDLMNSQKPHILKKYVNNFGKETSISYKSSTYFYLKDKREGKPWTTKLPFPVQVVAQMTVEDKFTKTKFGNFYSYHHGYYDHSEREFRGFGRVEQVDIQEFGILGEANASSPYITRTENFFSHPLNQYRGFTRVLFWIVKSCSLNLVKNILFCFCIIS
jgi:hypothetical protein